MKMLKMPVRGSNDGAVSLSRAAPGSEMLLMSASQAGIDRTLTVSEYNAWRLFGMLAFMLKIPLAENVQKAIVFSDGTESPCPVRPPVDGEMLFALVKQVSGFAGDDHDVVGLVGHVQKISKAGGTVP